MYRSESKFLTVSQLSKDEESSTPDAEVTREDQDKINAFSRLHNREKRYEEELEHKQVRFLPEFGRSIGTHVDAIFQKEKEDLEEISTELELADEDELVPYHIGDSFMSVPLPEAQSLLEESSKEIEEDVSKLEGTLTEIRDEMKQLKAQLYARFGRSINLET